MKKIIGVLITVIFLLSIVNVKASFLISAPKTLNDSYLEDVDLIIKNNVNWQMEGDYELEYFNKSDLSFYSKDVKIVSLKDLENGLTISKEKEVKYDPNFKLYKIIYVNNNEYFLLGSIDLKTYPYPTQDDALFPYVAYYKNNTLVWSRILKSNRYGKVVDGILTEYGIAIIGDYDSLYQEKNVFLEIITFNNIVIFSKELSGSKNDYAKSIHYYNNFLYFTGVSESKDLDFCSETIIGYDVFVGKVNLQNTIFEIIMFGNMENDNLYTVIFDKANFYLLCCLRGEGRFYNNLGHSKDFITIVAIDYQFELYDYEVVNFYNSENHDKLIFTGDYIIYSYLTNNSGILITKVYDKSLFLRKVEDVNLKVNNIKIHTYEMINVDNNIFLYLFINHQNKFKEISIILSNDLEELSYQMMDAIIKEITYINQFKGMIRIVKRDEENAKLTVVDLFSLKLEKSIIDTSDYLKNDYQVYFNGRLLPKEEINKTQKTYFGKYTDLYRVKVEDVEIVIPVEVYLYPKINVTNNEIYDEGLTLKFNGKGYLNDIEISNNYKINEPGKYTLEVIGLNNEKKIINFTVKKIALDYSILDDQIFNEYTKHQNNHFPKDSININYYDRSVEEIDGTAVTIVLSMFTIGVLIGFFVPLNIIKRWKNV